MAEGKLPTPHHLLVLESRGTLAPPGGQGVGQARAGALPRGLQPPGGRGALPDVGSDPLEPGTPERDGRQEKKCVRHQLVGRERRRVLQ